MQSVIGALRVNLGIDTAAFQDGLRGAEAALKRTGKQLQQIGQSLSLSVTAPLVGAGALVLRTAGNFEAGMNRVRAALGASDTEFAALSDEARRLGVETQFSATEAADAIEILAKNGLAAADILGGALKASLDLAAASGTDLGTAGDIATDVMLQFGRSAADLGPVVDQITGVLLQSKFGIDDYRLALGQAGGVVGGLGIPFEEFNAALAATSSLFASGSDAGTSFKTFVTRLVPTSKEAATAMAELGLKFTDADGALLSMRDVAEQLRVTLGGLSDEAKAEALTTIFGTDAMRTAIGLMNTGAEGMERLLGTIADASGAEQAEARMQGLNGALKSFSSAVEGLQLAIAESGLIEAATGIVEGITNMVRAMSEADPKLIQFGVTFAAMAAAIGPAMVAVGLAMTALTVVGGPIALVVAGLVAAGAAIVTFRSEIAGWITAMQEGFVAGVAALHGFGDDIEAFVARVGEAVAGMVQGVIDWFAAGGPLGSAFRFVRDGCAGISDAARWMYDAVVGNSWVPDMVEGVEAWLGRLAGSAPALAEQATGGIGAAFEEVGDTILGAMDRAIDGVGRGSAKIGDILKGLALDMAKVGLRSLAEAFIAPAIRSIAAPAVTRGTPITSARLPGFATGGSFTVGGMGGVDSQVVAFRATPGEMVDVRTPGQAGGRGVTLNQVNHFPADVDPARMRAFGDQIKRETMAGLIAAQREAKIFR